MGYLTRYRRRKLSLPPQLDAWLRTPAKSGPTAFSSTTPSLDSFIQGLPMMQNAARLNANNPIGGAPSPAQMLGAPTAVPQGANISAAMQTPQNALPQATQQPQMQQADVQQKLAQILLG